MENEVTGAGRTGFGPDAAIDRAEHWRELGRFDLAEEAALRAIATDPDNAHYQVLLGWIYYGWEKQGPALECARTAITQDPTLAVAHSLLGALHHKEGRNTKAEESFLEALRLEPTDSTFLFQYGTLMHSVGQNEKAENLLLACLQQDPEDASAHSLLALVRSEKNRSADADASGRSALKIAPDEDFSHYSMGVAYFRRGRPFKAKKHLREAVRIDPGDTDIVEMYEHIDWHTRWTSLPLYYFSLLVGKIPGAQFTLWGVLVALLFGGKSIGLDSRLITTIGLSYLGLVIYSWVASPITNLWIKLRPCR